MSVLLPAILKRTLGRICDARHPIAPRNNYVILQAYNFRLHMDIFNRTPAIAEDTIQYTLDPGPAFPDKSAVITLATLIDSYVSSVLPDHIWHRDTFELKVINSPYSPGTWCIEGHMRVGDCVDDEWCVVWLLRDITKRWDVAVK